MLTVVASLFIPLIFLPFDNLFKPNSLISLQLKQGINYLII